MTDIRVGRLLHPLDGTPRIPGAGPWSAMRQRFAARRAKEAEDLIRCCMESEDLSEGKKVFQGGKGVAIAGYPWEIANISLRFSEEVERFVCHFEKCGLYMPDFRTGS